LLLLCCLTVATAQQPNIVFILTDDLGYGDLGVTHQDARAAAGQPAFDTPELDTLAAQGALLTRHYAGAPVCAPSRASLLTGMHQGHATVRDNQFDKELEDTHTLASVLSEAGYATAVIGKWGIGGTSAPYNAHPQNRGFDYFFGVMEHGEAHAHYLPEAGHSIFDGTSTASAGFEKCYSTDLFTARAKKWISDHHTANPTQPFFLYLAYTSPHARLQVPTQAYPAGSGQTGGLQWVGTPGNMINTASGTIDSWIHPDFASTGWPSYAQRHATMVRRLDTAVGDLLDLLDDLGVGDNTLVVFSSDNGPHHENGIGGSFTQDPQFFQSYGNLDGSKRDLWEGGWRVPTLVRWPDGIPAGRVVGQPSQFHDWLATFAVLAGEEIPARIDGVSLVPDLTGVGNRTDGIVYSEYTTSFFLSTQNYPDFEASRRGRTRGHMQALYVGGEKGVRYNVQAESDAFEVYETHADPGEAVNLAGQTGAPSQTELRAGSLRVRRVDSSATRAYDTANVSALESTLVGLPSVSVYPGTFPWTPRPSGVPDRIQADVPLPSVSMLNPSEAAALVFHGILNVPATGDYEFFIRADQGAVARLHGMLLADSDRASGGWVSSGTVKLEQGLHPLWLTSRHGATSPQLGLDWAGPGFSREAVPASAFDPANRSNTPPVLQIDSPTQGALLPEGHGLVVKGAVTDDGNPAGSSVTVAWSVQTSPSGAVVTFSPPDAVSTRVRMDLPGTYVLRCTATDGAVSTSTDIEVEMGVLTEPPSPFLWYPLSADFQDAAGTNHATAQSGTRFVGGVLDGAVDLNANGEYFDSGSPVAVAANSSWSFSVWFRLNQLSSGNAMILQQLGTGRSWLYVTSGGALSSFIGNASTSGGSVALNEWVHSAVVADAGRVKLYLNGHSVADEVRSLEASTAAFRLGNQKTAVLSNQFFGQMEDAAVYNRALTPGEIERMAAAAGNRAPAMDFSLPAEGRSHVPFAVSAAIRDEETPSVQWFANPSTGVVFDPADAASTDVTLPGAGTFTLGLEADDGVQTSFAEGSFPVITPSMAWRRTHFGTTENAGDAADTADPNSNGIPNLYERALGYDPNAAGAVELPGIEIVPVEGSPLPAIRFRRLAGGTEAAAGEYRVQDLVFRVRGGDTVADAATWPVLEVVEVSAETQEAGVERVMLRVPSLDGAGNRYFLRLEIYRD
jgi:uncharacterized sulfatase